MKENATDVYAAAFKQNQVLLGQTVTQLQDKMRYNVEVENLVQGLQVLIMQVNGIMDGVLRINKT
jgi:hypothetical protein